MRVRNWALQVALAVVVGGCSPAPKPGRVVVAVTIDWEGAYLSPEGLDALDALRAGLDGVPLTHFISAGYFTKDKPDPTLLRSITQMVRTGDELAVHLHAWRSLAHASGVEPKLSPSFLSGTNKLLEFEDGDVGFDTDLDAYDVASLRPLLRTSRRLLESTKLPVSKSFRAGGYLGTPKVLQALRDEGFTVDSSATDARQLDERSADVLPTRVAAIWPKVNSTTQPFAVHAAGKSLVEMPIAAFADYATAAEIIAIFDAAEARLKAEPSRDVFVVLGFHQETASEFASRLGDALRVVRGRRELAAKLTFTTIEAAAQLAGTALSPAP